MSEALIANLQKENDDLKAEGHKYRGRIRQLKDQVTSLTTERDQALEAAKPKDGTTALDAEQTKRWEAYEAIGKKPEEIVTALTKSEEATGKLAQIEWNEAARKAAALAGFENPEAFLAFPGVRDLKFEIRTEKVNGKDEERPYVTHGNDTKSLDMDFVDSRDDWKALKGALVVKDETGSRTYTPDRPEKRTPGKATEEVFRKATEATASYNQL